MTTIVLKRTVLIITVLVALGAHVVGVQAADVRVSVAASLTDVFKELAANYTVSNPGVEIVANFGASGTLAKQIVQGAPADLFISANQKWLDYLLAGKAVAAETAGVLAGNRLVFVGRSGTAATLADLRNLRRIVIGSPHSVPAGQYAEEILKKAGLYEQLIAEKRLVLTQDVRQALVYAERGEVDGAFVYQTDARGARSAVVLFVVPSGYHEPITYPLALTSAGIANEAARSFLVYLQTPAARTVLMKYGFLVD